MTRAAHAPKHPYLYPTLDDPQFNPRIAQRKEFYDTRYEGGVRDVVAEAEKLCSAEFELAPHQLFVRNFMSMQTPYNGLLLYHGLGSGKTCSAIGVAEEMRDYLRHTGAAQGREKIIIVAAPNVQQNFRTQLFDPSRLEEKPRGSGLWSIRSCTGMKYLREVNPLATAHLSREKIERDVRRTIRASYKFYGYEKFANLVAKMLDGAGDDSPVGRRKQRALEAWAANRLIIVDEAHNMGTFDSKDKAVAETMEQLVRAAPRLRLLLLSATPMYHDPKEIVWLLNLLRANDGRPKVSTRDVFAADGTFTEQRAEDGGATPIVGRELLQDRATGYVSFVRGENPYTFPYRIWPSMFAPDRTPASVPLGRVQLNGRPVDTPLQHLQLYIVRPRAYQAAAYRYICDTNDMSSLQYTVLQVPIQALDMTYPAGVASTTEALAAAGEDPSDLVAARGLARTMDYSETGEGKRENRAFALGSFAYKPGVPEVFSQALIGDYGAKIAAVVDACASASGLVLVHTEYIPGGVLPLALALESRGFKRAGNRRSLFKAPQTEPLDYRPGGPPPGSAMSQAAYAVITGDQGISPDNASEVKLVTADDNVYGQRAKVVIISQAGAEGLDLKYVRQVHVMEPWYNMSRIEQIIGRAVRTCSHKALPFPLRNVQIFLYGSKLPDTDEEAADVYVFRQAEARAVRIGRVARALKESAVDCLLNLEQTGFTVEQMAQSVPQTLGGGQDITYAVGDRPYTAACDYLETCAYKCSPVAGLREAVGPAGPRLDTFSESALLLNSEMLMQRVRKVFRELYFVGKTQLVAMVTARRSYPLVQIDAALSRLVDDRSERITDKYGRVGRLVNVGQMYLFQPLELGDTRVTVHERQTPLAFKREAVRMSVPPPALRRHSSRGSTPGDQMADALADLTRDYENAYVDGTGPSSARLSLVGQAAAWLRTTGLTPAQIAPLVVGYLVDRLDELGLTSLLDGMSYGAGGAGAFTTLVRNHLEHLTLRHGRRRAVMGVSLVGRAPLRLLVQRPDGGWGEATSEDRHDFREALEAKKGTFEPYAEKLGTPLGFLYPFRGETMAFKLKDMHQVGKTGARCDQGATTYVKQAVVSLLEGWGYRMDREQGRSVACAVQELLLRHRTRRGEEGEEGEGGGGDEGRAWFVSPANAVLLGLPKLHF